MKHGNGAARLLFITEHLAPYNVPALSSLHESGAVEVTVLALLSRVGKHSYWPAQQVDCPTLVLRDPDGRPRGDGRRVWQILKEADFDVAAIGGYRKPSYMAALAYCVAHRKPFVWVIDSVLKTPRTAPVRIAKKIPMHLITRTMGAAWVPGRASVQYLMSYGVERDKIFEGCYCLDSERLLELTTEAQLRRTQIRQRLQIEPEDMAYLFVGRMIPERGLQYLLEAWRQACSGRPRVRLLLVGRGPERSRVEAFVARHDLRNVALFDPVPVEDLVEFYVASDVYLQPSISETYSLTTAQAALSGLALVVTDQVGAADDFVKHGQTGYLVQSASAEGLADVLNTVSASDLGVLRGMGGRARRLAVTRTAAWAAGELHAATERALTAQ